jgi:hypothetical protein
MPETRHLRIDGRENFLSIHAHEHTKSGQFRVVLLIQEYQEAALGFSQVLQSTRVSRLLYRRNSIDGRANCAVAGRAEECEEGN